MLIEQGQIEEPEVPEIETPEVEQPETESVADSVRAAMRELGGEDEEADQNLQGSEGEEGPTAEETANAARTLAKSKKKRQTVEAKDLDLGKKAKKQEPVLERIEPPLRFPVDKKEWFNRQAREVQEEVARAFREQEAYFTKNSQEIAREKSRYSEVNQIVDTYLPKWGISGLTPQAAVAELCATQDWIMENPIAAYSHMLEKSGLSPEDLIAARDGQSQAPQQRNTQDPAFLALQEKIDSLYSRIDQQHQSQEQQALHAAVSEVDAVRRETTADGTYLYPELWDQAQLQRVQPFVEDLRKTQPGISMAEATKRAIFTLRVLDGKTGSPSPTSQKLPTQELNKLKSAAVSVSGRGNGLAPVTGMAHKGETVAESLRAVMAGFNQQN